MSGSKMRELRNIVGIGQAELAERVGVSQSMISQIEADCRKGAPDTIEAIAAELHCTVEELTGEPKFFVQFVRNCKRLSQAQLMALNKIVLLFLSSPPAEINEGEQTGTQQTKGGNFAAPVQPGGKPA